VSDGASTCGARDGTASAVVDWGELRHRAFCLARGYGAQSASADDIAQEAILRLLRRGARVAQPRAWLRTVVYRLVLAAGSQCARDAVLPPELRDVPDALPSLAAPGSNWSAIEAIIDLRRALAHLPPRQARVLELQARGTPSCGIAHEMRTNVVNVRKLRERARSALLARSLSELGTPR
jgi:RNA polymerase sigma factor (sigma-70 family)